MVYIASMAAMAMTGEHAEDVLERLLGWLKTGQDCALAIVTHTEGGAVRAPGALLAIGPDGRFGYISGGCIDTDVELQARQACADGQVRRLRYGAGSPFVDLPLPCGGAIELVILPNPVSALIEQAHGRLRWRESVYLSLSAAGELKLAAEPLALRSGDQVFCYAPKLRLRIAGRGSDALALAKMSEAAGFETRIQLVDEDDISTAKTAGLTGVEKLNAVSDLKQAEDDRWTAFVLLFHDQDWEVPLLQQALAGPAFYIGAVGSLRTHDKRCRALSAAGCSEQDIARVRGPIGLVPSLRDASYIAISTLAEIIEAYPGTASAKRQSTALVLLAAGTSSRYEDGDKLLAKLNGKPVLAHAGALDLMTRTRSRVAVVPSAPSPRSDVLTAQGWGIISTPNAKDGQSTSLVSAVDAIQSDPDIDQIILVLGDMPNVPAEHLDAMSKLAEHQEVSAIMSECDGVLSPPALFKRQHFDALSKLSGDQGAKSVFLSSEIGRATLQFSPQQAQDIDHVADLARMSEVIDA
mgnify:CR=1 FL=1